MSSQTLRLGGSMPEDMKNLRRHMSPDSVRIINLGKLVTNQLQL